MFSIVVAGRLPLPAPQQIDATHALFPLEDAASINHVTVFMTGQQAFPPGYAATVHLNWKTQGEDRWLLLGCLRNERPSAIYRIKGLTQQQQNPSSFEAGHASNSVAIGISIETTADVDTQMANKGASKPVDTDGMQVEEGDGDSQSTSTALVRAKGNDPAMQANIALALAPRIATNAFSYLSSFAPDSAPQTVPLLKRWLEQFERKVKGQGVAFLAKEAE